jgi:hypothetical protein
VKKIILPIFWRPLGYYQRAAYWGTNNIILRRRNYEKKQEEKQKINKKYKYMYKKICTEKATPRVIRRVQIFEIKMVTPLFR